MGSSGNRNGVSRAGASRVGASCALGRVGVGVGARVCVGVGACGVSGVRLKRTEMALPGIEGSREGGDSGQGERRAGRGEGEAGREKTRKKPNPVRDSAWSGEGSGA